MKSTSQYPLVSTIAAIVVFLSSMLFADNGDAKYSKSLDKIDIPAAVSAAFQKAYPRAKVTGADRELKDGKVFYEIESIDGKVERNILYTAEGVTFEIEEGIELGKLLTVVKTGVEKEYPRCKIEKAEKIVRGEIVEYELLIASGQNRIELVTDASGHVIRLIKTITVTEDNDEDGEDQED